jgi:hypothetical protein
MADMSITVNGTLHPDGITVQLEKKVGLPPGRVTLEVRPANPPSGPTMLEVLDRIHRDQRQRGQVPMSDEEMAREIERMRHEDDEYEERWRKIWNEAEGRADRAERP